MTLRWQWCTSLCTENFPAQAYERLCEATEQATPFNRLGWLRGAEQALTEHQALHILLGWQDAKLLLCLPLIAGRESRGGLPLRVLRHLGHPLSDRLALLVAPAARSAMAEALGQIRRRLPHDLLQLHELVDAAGVLEPWRRASSYGEQSLGCRVPEHQILPSDRDEASGTLRYELRRAKKRCAEIDARVVRLSPSAQDIDQVLQRLCEVEQSSWKGTDGLGIFSGARRQQWMFSALHALAAEDRVRVAMLEHQGRCISYRLGLLERGRLYDYNIAFLADYANLGSGRLLLDEWIRWGLEDGWQWVDASRVSLSRSSHQLHERLSGLVEHQRWSFYSWRPRGLLAGLGERLWQRLKPHFKAWRERRLAATAKKVRP
ncbi:MULTISPECIES: GNAT family N-acetyltransferase [unclassified Pseudomonas]|uniref:GNAT family N-acetyltransferase n=1 Tax=unclassified Pseudomonas TaxID=196821 RepID=UPI0008392B52|nr:MULTISPECIES: GNAT family N-acetyltransferase [unclassified Pseudomonas]QIH07944.1 GNAT family N-acetyltransferase [Pseudomonas sp. BIOMIG1BAC]